MLLSRLRLVTFDVTDTLLKFRLTPGQQYGEIGALYGISSNGNQLSKNFKTQWQIMSLKHPNFGRHTGLGWEKWWQTIVIETFRDCNMNIEDAKLNEIANHLIELYKISSCWSVCEGVNGLLSYIRSKRVLMGVISNFDPRLNITLSNMKLKHYFKFVLTSYEAGFEKPDSKIFERAMQESNLKKLKPEECLHIGDQISLDYNGAINSGWNAFLISDTDKVFLKKKHPNINTKHVFNDLFELHKYLMQCSNEQFYIRSL